MKLWYLGVLATLTILSSSPALAGQDQAWVNDIAPQSKTADDTRPEEMEIRGLRSVEAPWQAEALSIDTRQIQALQIIDITLSPETKTEWDEINRDRRGIAMVQPGEDGQNQLVSRRVLKVTFRVMLYDQEGNFSGISEAVASPDGQTMRILLSGEGTFTGMTAFVLSSRGDYALSLSGELSKLKRRERRDRGSRLADIIPATMATSRIAGTTLVRRGDSSLVIETLEATFTEHVVLNGTNRYSGLPGTFLSSDQEAYPSVAALFTREDTVGDRLITCGNGMVDPTLFTGLGAIIRVVSLGMTAARSRC